MIKKIIKMGKTLKITNNKKLNLKLILKLKI